MVELGAGFVEKLDKYLDREKTSFTYYDFYRRAPDYEEEMEFAHNLYILMDEREFDLVETHEIWPPNYVFKKRVYVHETLAETDEEDDGGWITVKPKSHRKLFIPKSRNLVKILGKGEYMENRYLCLTPCSFCIREVYVLISCANEGCEWLTCLVCMGAKPERKLCGGCGFDMSRK